MPIILDVSRKKRKKSNEIVFVMHNAHVSLGYYESTLKVMYCKHHLELTDSTCRWLHRKQEVTFFKAISSLVGKRKYSHVDLPIPISPSSPCLSVDCSHEAA